MMSGTHTIMADTLIIGLVLSEAGVGAVVGVMADSVEDLAASMAALADFTVALAVAASMVPLVVAPHMAAVAVTAAGTGKPQLI